MGGNFHSNQAEEVKNRKTDLIEIAKVAPHRVKPIQLPDLNVAKEKMSYDYFDMTIRKSPKRLKTAKCIPPKRFGSKTSVVTKKKPEFGTSFQSYELPVRKIDRMVISEESIKKTEFVENLFGRISEFTQLIVEDNHKCYLYYCKDFYHLLESAKRAIHTSPAKIIPEITIHHWKTISKLTGCLVKWL